MRAFVTGGTGFVGSHVVRRLMLEGWEVFALVRPASAGRGLNDLPTRTVSGEPTKLQRIEGSLADQDILREAMRDVDCVFHVAADYRLWTPDPRAMYASNVDGTANVLRAAHTARAGRVVYTSTVGVLGRPVDGRSATEDCPASLAEMVGHYKRSKFLAQELVDRVVAETGIDVVCVFPTTPVGERDDRPTPTGRVILEYLRGRMPAYVDTGLNLVDVRDVAMGHLLAAKRGVAGGRYILGNQNMTLREILCVLADIVGLRPPRVRLPIWLAYGIAAIDTLVEGVLLRREPAASLTGVRMSANRMYFSAERAVRELGLPQTSVREALARAVDWYVRSGMARPAVRPGAQATGTPRDQV